MSSIVLTNATDRQKKTLNLDSLLLPSPKNTTGEVKPRMPRKTVTLPTPLETTLSRRFQPVPHSYTERDVSLYALAVGAAAAAPSASASSSADDAELRFVFDGAAGFAPLPTFPCTFPYFGVTAAVPFEEILPSFNPVSLILFCPLSGRNVPFSFRCSRARSPPSTKRQTKPTTTTTTTR